MGDDKKNLGGDIFRTDKINKDNIKEDKIRNEKYPDFMRIRDELYPHIPDESFLWRMFACDRTPESYNWLRGGYLRDLTRVTKVVGVDEDMPEERKKEYEKQSIVVHGEYAYPWIELLFALGDCNRYEPFANRDVEHIADFMRERKRRVRVVVPRKKEYAPSFLYITPKKRVVEEGLFSKEEVDKIFGETDREGESALFYVICRKFGYQIREKYLRMRGCEYSTADIDINDIRAIEFLFYEGGINMKLYLEPREYESEK